LAEPEETEEAVSRDEVEAALTGFNAGMQAAKDRLNAGIKLIYPEHLTPMGKRVLDQILEDMPGEEDDHE
jgi:hypothetical protein